MNTYKLASKAADRLGGGGEGATGALCPGPHLVRGPQARIPSYNCKKIEIL